MKTRKEVAEFLHSLQWKRTTTTELQDIFQKFFNTKNELEDSTVTDDKDYDYSFVFTNGDRDSVSHFIDIEIFYLKMRRRNHILITEPVLLDYED